MFEIRCKIMTKRSDHRSDKGKTFLRRKGKKRIMMFSVKRCLWEKKIKHLVCALKRL